MDCAGGSHGGSASPRLQALLQRPHKLYGQAIRLNDIQRSSPCHGGPVSSWKVLMSPGAGARERGGLCTWGQRRGKQSVWEEESREGVLLLSQAGPKGLWWGPFLPSKGGKRQTSASTAPSHWNSEFCSFGSIPFASPTGSCLFLSPQLPSLTCATAAFFPML